MSQSLYFIPIFFLFFHDQNIHNSTPQRLWTRKIFTYASTGTDCQPYFRIFSPLQQLKKYDKDCQYVKKWIPELRSVPNKIILNWETKNKDININYPKPILNIKETSKLFIKRFKEI